MNTQSRSSSASRTIGQNAFGAHLAYALAALEVTEIDRSNRTALDTAFVVAHRAVTDALGFERTHSFNALVDPNYTSEIVNDIITYAWLGRLVFVSNDNFGLLYINRDITPDIAMEYIQKLETPELWLNAGRAFMAYVTTYSNPAP